MDSQTAYGGLATLRWFELGEKVKFIHPATYPFLEQSFVREGIVEEIAPVVGVSGTRTPESAYYLVDSQDSLHVVRALTSKDITRLQTAYCLFSLQAQQVALYSVSMMPYTLERPATKPFAKKKLWKRFQAIPQSLKE